MPRPKGSLNRNKTVRTTINLEQQIENVKKEIADCQIKLEELKELEIKLEKEYKEQRTKALLDRIDSLGLNLDDVDNLITAHIQNS